AAFAVGALLALSGSLMQVLLRNPLADPYILGVSGGAAVGGLSVIAAGAAGSLLPVGAFGGAFGSILLVFALAGGDRSHAQTRLLLTGVVIAAGWGAVTALLLALSPDTQLRGMVFWLLGDLSAGGLPFLALATLVLALALTLPRAPALNVLAQGDLTAQALGVPVVSLRRLLGGDRRHHRLRRAAGAPPRAPGAGQRPAHPPSRLGPGRRRPADPGRYRRALGDRADPAPCSASRSSSTC
ncbi:MAG: putative transporter system, permease, partial [Proteobacteria bacterium]|nr:putative transporter system, permease [Pseudomonadota bacterium]